MIPDPLVDEIKSELDDGVDEASAGRGAHVAAEEVDNAGGGDRADDAVADGFGDAAGMGIHGGKAIIPNPIGMGVDRDSFAALAADRYS